MASIKRQRQSLVDKVQSMLIDDEKLNLVKLLIDNVLSIEEKEKLVQELKQWKDNDIFNDIELSSTEDILAVAQKIKLFLSRVDSLTAWKGFLRVGLMLHFPVPPPGQKLDRDKPNRNMYTRGNTLPENDTLWEIYKLIEIVLCEQYEIPVQFARVIAVHIVMQTDVIPIILPSDAASKNTVDYQKAKAETEEQAVQYIIDAITTTGVTHLLILGSYPWELYNKHQEKFSPFTILQKGSLVHTSKVCKNGATVRELCELIMTVLNIIADLLDRDLNFRISPEILEISYNNFHVSEELAFGHSGTDEYIYEGRYGEGEDEVVALRGKDRTHMRKLIGGLEVTMSHVFPNDDGVKEAAGFPTQQYLLDEANTKRDIDGLRIELVHFKDFNYSLGFGIIDEEAVEAWKDYAANKPEERMMEKVKGNMGEEAVEYGMKSVNLLNSLPF